jgi:hypothetical protein
MPSCRMNAGRRALIYASIKLSEKTPTLGSNTASVLFISPFIVSCELMPFPVLTMLATSIPLEPFIAHPPDVYGKQTSDPCTGNGTA